MLTETEIKFFTRVQNIEKCLHKWASNFPQEYRVQKMLKLTEIKLFTRVQNIEKYRIQKILESNC